MDEQDELAKLLGEEFSQDELDAGTVREDRGIIQPDGSRACVAYELSGQGYSILNTNKPQRRTRKR